MLDVTDNHNHWRVAKVSSIPNYTEQWRRKFASFDALPTITKESISVLAMCKDGESLEPIGTKVNRNTYWLFDNPPLLAEYEEEHHGNDTGSESKKEG